MSYRRVLAATVDEGRRGARHSAGAGRVDVIGHPVGADTYAGLHSVVPKPGSEEYRVEYLGMNIGFRPHRGRRLRARVELRRLHHHLRNPCGSVETRIGGNKKGVFTRPAAQGGRPRAEATVGEDV
jgi:hypothetical protein